MRHRQKIQIMRVWHHVSCCHNTGNIKKTTIPNFIWCRSSYPKVSQTKYKQSPQKWKQFLIDTMKFPILAHPEKENYQSILTKPRNIAVPNNFSNAIPSLLSFSLLSLILILFNPIDYLNIIHYWEFLCTNWNSHYTLKAFSTLIILVTRMYNDHTMNIKLSLKQFDYWTYDYTNPENSAKVPSTFHPSHLLA